MIKPNKKIIAILSVLLGVVLSQPFISVKKRATEIFFWEITHVEEGCEAIQSSDGSSFDWSYVYSDYYFEVCLRDLAVMLETPKRMAEWLRSEGFVDVSPYETNKSIYLNAQWREDQIGERIPFINNMSFFYRWITKNSPYRVQVRFEEGEFVGASAHYAVI